MKYITIICMFLVTKISVGQVNIPTLIQKIKPAVVTIVTFDEYGDTLSLGSGFFINTDGVIVSSRHVLSYADSGVVKTADGQIYVINNIIAEHVNADLIMFDIKEIHTPTAYLKATKSLPHEGEHILVIGSPFGLELSISDGIVSAVREIPEYGSIIQITAPISSGSSGGPVINDNGTVIGVATFQYIDGQNLNFAIPGKMLYQLKATQKMGLRTWSQSLVDNWLLSEEGLAYSGYVMMMIEDYDSAIVYLKRAVIVDSLNAVLHSWMGYCYAELGNYKNSIKNYRKVIILDPQNAIALYNIGHSYYSLNNYDEAISAFEKASRILSDDADIFYWLGRSYYAVEDYLNAVNALFQTIEIDTFYSEAYCSIALIYGELEMYDTAIEYCYHAIVTNPSYADAYYVLGCLYAIQGDKRTAWKVQRKLKEIDVDLANELKILLREN